VPFSSQQAARLTGCSASQLAYWARIGLVTRTEGGYSFRDLVALRVVSSLLEAGLSPTRARKAVRALVDAGEDVSGLRIITDGDRVWACRDDGQILDALKRGQLALFVAVDAFEDQVRADVRTFDDDRRRFVDQFDDHPSNGFDNDGRDPDDEGRDPSGSRHELVTPHRP
jgi:DNA-binding transcriptional MerR regulator